MPDIKGKRYLHQTAVYWQRTGNRANGQPAYAAAIEIECRWEDEAVEYLAPDGRKLISKSWVMVDRDLLVGGALKLGLLTDLTNATEPFRNTGTYEIMQVMKTPNRKATKFLREVIL